jgi:tetratricopeptide (TPR) repeat protein
VAVVIGLIVLIWANYGLYEKWFPPSPEANAAPVVEKISTDPVDLELKNVAKSPDVNSYLNLGLAYYNARLYDDAIKAWTKALEYDPQNALIYNNIGSAYGALNRPDEEINACTKAITIKPDFDLAKRNLNWAQQQKKTLQH